MSLFLQLAFLFFLGSTIGWVVELLFRRWRNPENKWINPGFCTGPYLPLYGFGLCLLYLLAQVPLPKILGNGFLADLCRIVVMGLGVTALEFLAGVMCLKYFKVRLWDYRGKWGNIQGIVCPQFTLTWIVVSGFYYKVLHERMIGAVEWLSRNLAFSFVVGLFAGILLVDVFNSGQLIMKLKKYAEENELVIQFEAVKNNIRKYQAKAKQKYHFFRPFRTDKTLAYHLKELQESFVEKKQRIRRRAAQRLGRRH